MYKVWKYDSIKRKEYGHISIEKESELWDYIWKESTVMLGQTPYYIRRNGPDENGIFMIDYGSHSDFLFFKECDNND